MSETLGRIRGLAVFWLIGTTIAEWLGSTASIVVMLVVLAVILSCVGSMVVSKILGGKDFDHLLAGIMLALPGWLLMHFLFHWDLDLSKPTQCWSDFWACGAATLIKMFLNTLILVVGMAILCIPVLPVLWKLHRKAQTNQ